MSGDAKLKDQLEFNLSEGRTMIVTNVETNCLDPVLVSLLRNRIVRKGDANYVNLNGSMCACHEKFKLYLVTRESNPTLSTNILSHVRVIDFTVTSKALEDQLLADVVSKEQSVLETQMRRCTDRIASDTSSEVHCRIRSCRTELHLALQQHDRFLASLVVIFESFLLC